MPHHPVFLLTALPAEAKPIRIRFGLDRVQPDRGYPVYRRGHLALVVSGVGKLDAAAATAFLYAASGCPADASWINLGIAGHASLPLGTPYLAQRVADPASGRSWELPLDFTPPCPGGTLSTLERPDFHYAGGGAFDMEASGFCTAAARFARPGRVHCLKVISDNREQPGHGLSGKGVRRLIEGRLDLLEQLIHLVETP